TAQDGIQGLQACLASLVSFAKQSVYLFFHVSEGPAQFPNFISTNTLSGEQPAVRDLFYLVGPNQRSSLGQACQWNDYPAMHGEPEDTGSEKQCDEGDE